MTKQPYALAIHGGAGTILKSTMTPEKEAAYEEALRHAVAAGETVLQAGGSALDAVTASVCALEDEPLFNAGRGAVFTTAGKQEMDAAIMDGRNRDTGTVAGIFGPKNPVKLARLVMETTPHVCMIGEHVLELGRAAGLEFPDADYFFTQARWDALQDTLAMREKGEDDDDPARRHGTVGAVACDRMGNVAAATSTGGWTGKLPGRVGDTPMPGAGNFADNATCAVSGTGHGEIFIRWTAGAEIAARMRHLGETVVEAAEHVVMKDLKDNDGSGGVIAVDARGNLALPFNSEGMYRGWVREGDQPKVAIYRD
ncbi:isoaspartyl peptidase/L-asparaginase family protein [Frigidibacter sp. ROC022]|uniref:isoaspartyl peptidase/L-asparaginase family protein n=1 Tax=Frigidibacter sp. ROC022 TaxID=2971796 RepID=UPI00215A3181|nr:isoaspartyl peptidase/L-asparaginase [Frigidibacter sp. ROC022]MCR8723087.1 isoaspartyl peptidase/L-asparaginase [Frigidibacter sp. ROC022]